MHVYKILNNIINVRKLHSPKFPASIITGAIGAPCSKMYSKRLDKLISHYYNKSVYYVIYN